MAIKIEIKFPVMPSCLWSSSPVSYTTKWNFLSKVISLEQSSWRICNMWQVYSPKKEVQSAMFGQKKREKNITN